MFFFMFSKANLMFYKGTDWSSKQPQQTFNWSEANFHSQYPANLQQGEQFWSNQDLIGNSSEIRQPISDLQQQYTAYESATTGCVVIYLIFYFLEYYIKFSIFGD